MKRILVAGIGNIFLGDDAFGVEVACRLARQAMPDSVRVTDFGIRSYDLAYAITDGYDVTVLVDITQRGNPPGTLYLIEPDTSNLGAGGDVTNAHGMNPLSVLRMVRSLGGSLDRLYLVGCEPARLEHEDGEMGLSPQVEAAVPGAMEMIQSLIEKILSEDHNTVPNLAEVGNPQEGDRS